MMNSCKVYRIYVAVLYMTLMGIIGYSFFNRKQIYQPITIESPVIYHDCLEDDLLDSLREDVVELTKAVEENTRLRNELNKINDGK